MRLEEVNEELDRAEDGLLIDAAARPLRLRSVGYLAQLVQRAATELAEATNEWEAAMLRRLERAPSSPAGWLSQEDRVVTLRHQVQWAKAAFLAELVCILLSEAMGGAPVDRDTAGIGMDDMSRERIAWLAREGFGLRTGCPAKTRSGS